MTVRELYNCISEYIILGCDDYPVKMEAEGYWFEIEKIYVDSQNIILNDGG